MSQFYQPLLEKLADKLKAIQDNHYMFFPALSAALPRFLVWQSEVSLATAALTSGSDDLLSTILSMPLFIPGDHKVLTEAPRIANGEFPACAALTTGYVFRIENQATVYFLQRATRSGVLTTFNVRLSSAPSAAESLLTASIANLPPLIVVAALSPTLLSSFAPLIPASAIPPHWQGSLENRLSGFYLPSLPLFWFAGALLFSRLLNKSLLRRLAKPSWAGQPEPGERGELLVLLSQDRWARLVGDVDDLKAVTSGAWLREMTAVETLLSKLAGALVELAAGVAMMGVVFDCLGGKIVEDFWYGTGTGQNGKVPPVCLGPGGWFGQHLTVMPLVCWATCSALWMLLGVAVLQMLGMAWVNERRCAVNGGGLRMKGREVVVSERKRYERRRVMAEEYIQKSGRRDWAVQMGVVLPGEGDEVKELVM